MADQHSSIFNRLRRLQEQNRSNIPGMMTQKAMSTFSLQGDTIPDEPQTYVSVVVYPQDPFVSEPAVRQMSARDINPGLVNARFQIQDKLAAPARPDAQGNYLYWPGTPEFEQVNSFYYASFTLRMVERYAHRKLPWSFPAPHITLDPHAGDGANAFYSEQDRLLGFHSFKSNGTTIYAAQSADVVSHETGHAILDGIRDLYNESFGLGPAAFHESFGDMTAVLVALHDDSLVKRLLEWTSGNLRLQNFVAALAEEITELSVTDGEPIPGRTVYLRNALNAFTNIPFDKLPSNPEQPAVQLGRESHNYSRLFTGAFYDILVGIYERERHTTADRAAIHHTRDLVGHLLVGAIELAPVGELDFGDMAKAFLAADTLFSKGKYADILMRVFDERGLLTTAAAQEFLQSLTKLPEIRLPATMNSAMDAAQFLENVVFPTLALPKDIDLIPMNVYRNALGHVYMTYFAHREVMLIGDQFKNFANSHVDAFGGLTLAFDEKGLLCSACFRPVTDEDVRQIQILTADLIAQSLVISHTPEGSFAPAPLYMQPDTPIGLWLSMPPPTLDQSTPNRSVLVKYPVLFDRLPFRFTDILTYLSTWKGKSG